MVRGKNKILTLIITAVLSTAVSYNVKASFPTVKRLGGQDRYDTCVKVAQDGWESSYYAVLACGENYPDALSAVPLAKKYNAPILLTYNGYLPFSVMGELKRLKVGKVFVIGGNASVNSNIELQLNSNGMQTERLGGQDRYETSIKIAEKFGDTKNLTVATGEDFSDALSISPAAAAMEAPVVLVPKNAMPACVKNYAKKRSRDKQYKVFIMGDNNVISDNVVDEFQENDVERIIGDNKYLRNINAIARFLEKSDGKDVRKNSSNSNNNYKGKEYITENDILSVDNLYIASGDGFADALSGAALAARTKSPIILSGSSNSAVIKNFLLDKIPNYGSDSVNPSYLTVLGGEGVMPSGKVNEILGFVAFDNTITNGTSNDQSEISNSDSNNVIFVDKNFEKAIRDKLNIHDRELHFSDVKNITSLDLSNKGIKNISGLNNFISLTSLDLSNNEIKDIAALYSLTSLESLNLSHNNIDDVSYISSLSNLRELNLSDNHIWDLSHSRTPKKNDSRLDYDKNNTSVFRYLTALQFLDLSNSDGKDYYNRNRITSISEIKDVVSLVSLNLKNNSLPNLDDLKKLTELKTLNLSGTYISNLDFMKNLKQVTWLDISNNLSIYSKDLEALKNVTGLKYLNASNNKIDSISALSGLVNLTTLYVEDNPIKDYTKLLGRDKALYYKDFNIENIKSDTKYSDIDEIDKDIKNQIKSFETSYEHVDYLESRYTQIYRSYDLETYNSELKRLYKERDWINGKISSGNFNERILDEFKKDLENINSDIEELNRKNVMNSKVKDLEQQKVGLTSTKEKEKLINKINYVYSDYKYDYYRNELNRLEKYIDRVNMELQTNGQESPNYESANKIKYLQYELENIKKDKKTAEEKMGMYDKYKNFFNAIDAVLSEV